MCYRLRFSAAAAQQRWHRELAIILLGHTIGKISFIILLLLVD